MRNTCNDTGREQLAGISTTDKKSIARNAMREVRHCAIAVYHGGGKKGLLLIVTKAFVPKALCGGKLFVVSLLINR